MSKLIKNFTYGDLWSDVPELPEDKHGVEKCDPAKFTKNSAFINFIDSYGYDFYLDYDLNGLAFTDVTNKKIVVNANYSDEMIGVFLQHELGHLMLFDVNQFTTVRNDTLRSIMAKVIYTPKNLTEYGIEQLLFVENIVQDIFIETFSNDNCVCHKSLTLHRVNLGVKHLTQIESAKHIAQEVCENILKKPDEVQMPDFDLNELLKILESMLDGLKGDMQDIENEIGKKEKTNEFHDRITYGRMKELSKINQQLDRINRKLNNSKTPSPKLEKMKKTLEKEYNETKSNERLNKDKEKAENQRERALDHLKKKLNENQELHDEIQKQKESFENSENDPNSPGESPNSSNSAHSPVTPDLHKNNTDRKSEGLGTGGHSFDCGLPHPVSLSREESYFNEDNLVTIDSKKKVRKIEIQEDNMNNVLSNRIKIPENEFTYFKSNKKEFDATDMLKGKRKLRISGINVLVGLDVSGSMVDEWSQMFVKLSEMVENFQTTLDIENIVYFTYNQKLREASTDLNDLKIKAGGGNAFGYVYQDIMQTLPIMQRNEIILVTDCGDNLGFSLNDNCVVERDGSKVENHISIIDTENAGFYNMSDFDENDWSLYHYSDPQLFTNIKDNLEKLIER